MRNAREINGINKPSNVREAVMAAEEMYASNEYLENNPTWHEEDSPWKARQILKIIEKNNLQPNSVSEIGCGAGEIMRQLFLQMNGSVSFTGYEISPRAFELCVQKKRKGWIINWRIYLRMPPRIMTL
jgi:cyclopropane fatty-acyl-phospholipid synthase-like methyltransferase